MDKQRLHEIFYNRIISEVLYDDRPVWVQEIKNDTAQVGFIDNNLVKDVYIKDLYEET